LAGLRVLAGVSAAVIAHVVSRTEWRPGVKAAAIVAVVVAPVLAIAYPLTGVPVRSRRSAVVIATVPLLLGALLFGGGFVFQQVRRSPTGATSTRTEVPVRVPTSHP